ncbi:MAG TPA: right-handed parallel beta-helix repeat-containing protein [Kineosporiaceae bacterium]
MIVRPVGRLRPAGAAVVAAALALTGCSDGSRGGTPSRPTASGSASGSGISASARPSGAPGDPPTAGAQAATTAAVCGRAAPGPTSPPAGAVPVDPGVVGDLSAKTDAGPPGTTFWLAPGVHRLGSHQFDQVRPKDGDTYLGAPGAVLDGGRQNFYAFVGTATRVAIRHLTVRGFLPPVDQGVVNHDSGPNWVIEADTLTGNAGAALMGGQGEVVRGNCLSDNGQYGLNACCGRLGKIQVTGNEFVGNNVDDLERRIPGCGCTGGMKFWDVDGADVVGNWIHDNHGPGIWADTNNNDFLIEHNLIEGNDGPAVFYEISYNAVIRDNVIRRNAIVEGKRFSARKDPFPVAAIYLSEAGGEPRVPARTDRIDISGNLLTDNWAGITLWENADRFCNSLANTSTGVCTRLVSRASSCARPGIARSPLFGDCRWKTQRVAVHGNWFAIEPAVTGCTTRCSRMAVLSNYGTFPDWSPYKGPVVQQAIVFRQDNRWYDNTYVGPWLFTTLDGGTDVGAATWRAEPYRQDRGSTFIGTPSPTSSSPTTSTSPSATAATASSAQHS